MKSVLLSIQPKWCELIASGEKTVEIRKTKPKIETPFKCYIYETKGKTDTPFMDEDGHIDFHGRGQVIGEFICNMIVGVKCPSDYQAAYNRRQNTCVTDDEIMEYAKDKEVFYWHISDLVIYDTPKEISEFKKHNRTCYYDHLGYATPKCKECKMCNLKRPPQSWCYVEELRADNV